MIIFEFTGTGNIATVPIKPLMRDVCGTSRRGRIRLEVKPSSPIFNME